MSESIKKNDIIQGDPFGEIAKQINEALGYLTKFDDEVKQTAKDLTALSTASTKTVQGINAINEAEKASAKLVQDKLRNDKALEKMRLEEIRINKAREKSIDDYNKKAEKEAKIAKDSANAYKILERATRDQKNESKRLGAELLNLEANGEKNTKAFRALERQYMQTTSAAQKGDAQLKKLDKTVGDNFRSVGNYEKGLNGLKSAFGTLGAALGVGAVAGGIYSINKELDTATNTAHMFFGESEAGTKALAQEAIILGKTWGKETNEILAAANVLTKEFGLSGEEALAKINEGFNKGADVQGEFIDNIKEYSSQLTQAGLSADESIALITQSQAAGVFSDKGVDAIKEATLSLREMTQPAKDALAAIGMSGEELQRQIQSGELTYFEAMQKITAKTKEFGTGSQEAGMILADVFKGAGEDAGKFIFELDQMNLNLSEMGETSQGLDAAVGNLTRVFYEWLFGVNEAGGVTEKFAGTVQFLADNFELIVGTLWEVIKLYGYYKAAAIAINLKEQYSNWRSVSKGIQETGDGLQTSGEKAKAFGNALKGIGLALFISGLIEVATELVNIASGADDAARAVEGMNKAMSEGGKYASERLKKLQDEVGLGNKTKQQYEDQIKAEIRLMNAEKARTKEQIKSLESSKEYQDALATNPLFRSGADLRVLAQMKAMKESVFSVNAELTAFNRELTDMTIEERQATETTKQSTKANKGNTKEIKEKTQALEEYKVKLLEQDEVVRNLFDPNKVEQTLALEDERAITVANIAVLEAEIALKKAQQVGDTKAALEAEKALTKAKIEAINAQLKVDLKNELNPVKRKELELKAESDILGLGSVEKLKDTADEALKIAQQFQIALTQIATDAIDKRIELSKKEQDAAKSQQDYLEELAANGNITAQQSIAESIEIQREAQAEQIRLEKQKQNVELISAGLQTFNSALQSGKTPASALAETLVSTNVLVGLLKNLNFYEKGTDNAPGGLAVVDEKGAEIITDKHGNIKEVGAGKGPRFTMLNKGDKVYNATKSAAVFDAIANADKMRPMDQAGNSFDLMQLNGSLLNIEKAIKNQPTSSTEWGGILAGVGKVIETKTVGRSRIRNTFEL